MIITKSKIKTFNNKNKYLKKGGEETNRQQSEETNRQQSEETNGQKNELQNKNLKNLQTDINSKINTLKDHLINKNITINENDDSESILNEISKLNLLGDFYKDLYKILNTKFKNKSASIGGLPLTVNGKTKNGKNIKKLNYVVFSKLLNGIKESWPPEKQKELIKKAYGIEKKSMFGSMFSKKKENKNNN